ncbi:MAG: Gfo/Idh/MocA family oxidoreductase [Ruminococcaceae bacterium]|nr:Gfo/Idh/MocA family oxidoreductase [Oscillospiraceae bacterium]
MSKVKLGIIGVGNMGSTHVNNLTDGKCPEIELVAVADVKPERLEWAKGRNENLTCFNTAEEMLDSGLIDACLIAVPHYDHPRYAIACFERGIHVMCEKPAGVYTKQVKEMNAAAEKAGVAFGMMFNQRTNPMYITMHDMIASGELGEVHRTNWLITDWYRPQSYYDSGAWRATWSGEGGGVLLNQCPHNLDLWQWICGMPSKVDVKLNFGKWHDIEVEDDVTAYVEYPNGASGMFITSTGDCPGSNRFEVCCDRGTLVAEGRTLKITRLKEAMSEYTGEERGAFSSPNREVETITFDTDGEQHVGVLNAFAAHILHGTPLVADGREGINGLTISNAMHLSAFTDRVVELPFDDDEYYNELMKRVATSRRKENVNEVVSDTSGSYNGAK